MSNCKINYRRAKINKIRSVLRKMWDSGNIASRYMETPQQHIYAALAATAAMLDMYIQYQSTYRSQLPTDMQPFGLQKPIEMMVEEEFRTLYGNIREQVVAFILLFTTQLNPLENTAEGKFTLGLFKDLENSLEANLNQKQTEENNAEG